MNTTTEKLKEMPAAVKWSLFLSTLVLVISIIIQALNWKTVAVVRPGDYLTENQLIVGYSLGMLIGFWLIVLTALGKNWVRYLFVAMYAVWAFQLIFDFKNNVAELAGVSPVLLNLLDLTSVILLFTPSANKWFKRKSSVVVR